MKRALGGLEGSKDVQIKNVRKGLVEVTFDGGTLVTPSAIRKAIGSRYTVKQVNVTLTGDIRADGKAVMFKTNGSDITLDGADKLKSSIEKGKTHFQIAGSLTEKKVKEGKKMVTKLFLAVSSAKPLKKNEDR